MRECQQCKAYTASQLSGDEREHFERHLEECSTCREEVRGAESINDDLKGLFAALPAPASGARQKAQLLEAVGNPQGRSLPLPVWAGAALLIVLVGAGYFYVMGDPQGAGEQRVVLAGEVISGDIKSVTWQEKNSGGGIVTQDSPILVALGQHKIGLEAFSEVAFDARRAGMELNLSRGFLAVDKTPGENGTLHVMAGAVRIEVVGTRFYVERSPDKMIRVGVLRGKIRVKHDKKAVLLSKNESLTIGQRGLQRMPMAATLRARAERLLELGQVKKGSAPHGPLSAHGQKEKPNTRNTPKIVPPSMGTQKKPSTNVPDPKSKPAMRIKAPKLEHNNKPKPATRSYSDSELKRLIISRKFAVAQKALKRRLASNGSDGMAWWLLGELQRKQGQSDKAIRAYGKCVKHAGSSLANRARFRMALIHIGAGNNAAAVTWLRAYLTHNPKPLQKEASWRLARALVATGNTKAGVAVLTKMVRQYRGVYQTKAKNLLTELRRKR